MNAPSLAGWLHPQIDFPVDPELPELPHLFEPEWVWGQYCGHFGTPESDPERIRVRQFTHNLARAATVSYDVVWPEETYLPTQHFIARLDRNRPLQLFRFPDDPSLPGLGDAARPEAAIKLINKHVLSMGAKNVRVQVVRYRPGFRAVLRHSIGRLRFFVRAMRPSEVPAWIATWELVARSAFVAPRFAGCWEDGGIVWMSEIPGKNLRTVIRRGQHPDPNPLLEGLEGIWREPPEQGRLLAFNLQGTYKRARTTFRHNVRDAGATRSLLDEAIRSLDPFVAAWQPTCIAHNDFYDDQMLALPDGRIALVDHEEAGPGDAMLDVGNFLGHLRWSAHHAGESEAAACSEYHEALRQAALERFKWDEADLALREAVCIFRVCTNVIRHPEPDWRERLEAGLRVVNETLG